MPRLLPDRLSWISDGTVIFLAALVLRVTGLDINSGIDAISARQGLLILDFTQGIFHFPFSPYLLEFDETGLAYLMAPWAIWTDFSWTSFQLFSAVSGSLAAVFTYLLGRIMTGRWPGFFAGVCYAVLPHMLRWNRYFFMSGAEVVNSLLIISLVMILKYTGNHPLRLIVPGMVTGAACYVSGAAVLILPVLSGLLLINFWETSDRWSGFLKRFFYLIAGFFSSVAPMIIELIYRPYFLLWRQRHFSLDTGSLLHQIPRNFLTILRELLISSDHFMNQPAGIVLMGLPVTILICLSIFFIDVRQNPPRVLLVFYPVIWMLVLSFFRTEDWRGLYFIFIMPFLFILAGVTASRLFNCIPWRSGMVRPAAILLIAAFSIYSASEFFSGAFKMASSQEPLRDLQQDLIRYSDRPLLCSSRIPGVSYFHMPFWFAVRSRLPQAAVFSVLTRGISGQDGPEKIDLTTDPDGMPLLDWNKSPEPVYVLLQPDDFSSVCNGLSAMDQNPVLLEHSKLMLISCRLPLSIYAERTWTASAIPPIIGLDRED